MACWLLKSEPDVFSIFHLARRGQEPWDGVRNYQARNYLRSMKIGDQILFYHSNCATPGVAGSCRVVQEPRFDPTQFQVNHQYFDPKSKQESPRWWLVEVGEAKMFERLISLSELRTFGALSHLPLLRRGNRLSVMPVDDVSFNLICRLGQGENNEKSN